MVCNADKGGYPRSERSLIQTVRRAAQLYGQTRRDVRGRMTDSVT